MSVPRLPEILQRVSDETAVRRRILDRADLESRARALRSQRRSLAASLQAVDFGLITEVKRSSPSAGPLRPDLDPVRLAQDYERAGSRALSVLTCGPWFGGSFADLSSIRRTVSLPVLCKDFILESQQVFEAAAAGADAILLIAAALDDHNLGALSLLAAELGMEVLFEAHDSAEVDRLRAHRPTLLGINSRNLSTMEVDLQGAYELGALLPRGALGIFESGVKTPGDLERARQHGYRAALVGESLLRSPDPGAAVRTLLAGMVP